MYNEGVEIYTHWSLVHKQSQSLGEMHIYLPEQMLQSKDLTQTNED